MERLSAAGAVEEFAKPLARIGMATSGLVEPHAPMLRRAAAEQLLWKVMRAEDFVRSVTGSYLHFNRIDSYKDFPDDGQQLPLDEPGNAAARFVKSAHFSWSDACNRARSRTYACCFSLENSEYIWKHHGNGGSQGKIGLAFAFEKLRLRLNALMDPKTACIELNGRRVVRIFDINYGLVDYVHRFGHRANVLRLPNAITYAYMKDKSLEDEHELRITLSAFGFGHFAVCGEVVEFPASLTFGFDFRAALQDRSIAAIECSPDIDSAFVEKAMNAHGFGGLWPP